MKRLFAVMFWDGLLRGCAAGLLWNWKACWIGWHYSAYNRRLCVNLVPFFTLWFALEGGKLP